MKYRNVEMKKTEIGGKELSKGKKIRRVGRNAEGHLVCKEEKEKESSLGVLCATVGVFARFCQLVVLRNTADRFGQGEMRLLT